MFTSSLNIFIFFLIFVSTNNNFINGEIPLTEELRTPHCNEFGFCFEVKEEIESHYPLNYAQSVLIQGPIEEVWGHIKNYRKLKNLLNDALEIKELTYKFEGRGGEGLVGSVVSTREIKTQFILEKERIDFLNEITRSIGTSLINTKKHPQFFELHQVYTLTPVTNVGCLLEKSVTFLLKRNSTLTMELLKKKDFKELTYIQKYFQKTQTAVEKSHNAIYTGLKEKNFSTHLKNFIHQNVTWNVYPFNFGKTFGFGSYKGISEVTKFFSFFGASFNLLQMEKTSETIDLNKKEALFRGNLILNSKATKKELNLTFIDYLQFTTEGNVTLFEHYYSDPHIVMNNV